MSSVRRVAGSCVAALLLGSGAAVAQTSRGVGSVGATVGASGAGSRANTANRPTGAKLGDAPLATVPLFNDANKCSDTDTECRMYWLALQRADPEIIYDGGLIVRFPTELAVVMIPEDPRSLRDLLTCSDPAGKPIQWRDVVERGRTVAQVATDARKNMFDLTNDATTLSRPYRLVWCPTTPAGGTMPLGQSWRLRVARN